MIGQLFCSHSFSKFGSVAVGRHGYSADQGCQSLLLPALLPVQVTPFVLRHFSGQQQALRMRTSLPETPLFPPGYDSDLLYYLNVDQLLPQAMKFTPCSGLLTGDLDSGALQESAHCIKRFHLLESCCLAEQRLTNIMLTECFL